MREVLIGQTDYTIVVRITGTDGAPETGLAHTDIDIAYTRVETDNDVTTADVTPADLASLTAAHSDWGWEEISSTDHPGMYRLDIADAVFASGAWEAVVTITDASGSDFYAHDIGFRLVAFNVQDGVRLGLTALPNAAADGAGGLIISDAGGLDADAQLVTKINDILTDTGTTLQGELDGIQADTEDIQTRLPAALTADGNIKADTLRWGGTLVASANVLIDGAITAAKIAADAITAAKIAADAITAAKIADGAIDAATFAADVDAEILSYLVDDATRIDASALNTATVTTIPAIVSDTDQLQTMIVIRQNTAQTGSAGSITLDASASASNDFYLHSYIRIVGGTGSGQNWRVINAYVGATKVASITPNWITAPDNTSVFVIAGSAESHVRQVEASAITATSLATDAITAAKLAADAVAEIQSGLSTLTQADIRTAVGLASANLDTQLSALSTALTTIDDFLDTEIAAILAAVDTEVAAIKAKTDNLPTDPADASDIAASFSSIASTLSTIAAYIDTEVAAILAAVDTEVAAIKAKTDNLPTDPADQSALEALIDAVPTAAENAAAILAAGDVDGYSLEETLKLCLAALAGKLSGAATTTIVIRAADDSKDRITATVDADGNRSNVVLDEAG